MELNKTSEENEIELKNKKIIIELNKKTGVESIPFRPNSTKFIIPKVTKFNESLVQLDNQACAYKKLIFSSLHAACDQVFSTDMFANYMKISCAAAIPSFISFMNNIVISEIKPATILKDYETYRVINHGVKTQSSNLYSIIKLIEISLSVKPFVDSIKVEKYRYLHTLTNTKVAPPDEKEQYTLERWFSFHSWLRRDDIGIGNEMFNRIASPKALITSLRITTEISLYQIQEAKYALIDFIKENGIAPDELSPPRLQPSKKDFCSKVFKIKRSEWYSYIYKLIWKRFISLQEKYFTTKSPNSSLTLAFEIILHSWCQKVGASSSVDDFKNNTELTRRFHDAERFRITGSCLFSHDMVYALAVYAHSDRVGVVPVSDAEHILFQWIMAIQTVQGTDVAKLRLSNFRFLKRRNGQVTHIECEYFKGRSDNYHHVKGIKANSYMGKSLLSFFNDRTKGEVYDDNLLTIKSKTITTTSKGDFAQFIRLASTSSLRSCIETSLKKYNATPIVLDALYAIIEKGVNRNAFMYGKKDITMPEEAYWLMNCDTPARKFLFGLSTIKTSSVHARSDGFTPTQLTNYNSHTNETERKSYLTKSNQEWLNNCGRVTRAVMQDLQINVYSPSKSEIQSFNSEFTRAGEIIEMRKYEVLYRLKIVTGKKGGAVDSLGFLPKTYQVKDDFNDQMYLVDSPETVMRFHHYIHEVESKHKQLSEQANEYLLFSVLPTVEWMAILLAERKFSEKSLKNGKDLYIKYAEILPSHFSAQIGG